ncbi:hypothetical protein AMATHDRAFT_144979 [Amanita thiersii Skay4041]|uniref:Importin subunit beta-1/Transportin-1-like TPR repeats domain-containing protein n=1 Tax=Amanita thiersii Skay4041 TaxID=703135 RepID=A0A2A9NRZ2_9AGAR|nr:hypothetical protein AMATHDRAFT_144979 [Amanita thiersii Skay4041]
MATWAPHPASLQEILQTIHESTNTATSSQRSTTKARILLSPHYKLYDFSNTPEYIAYLAYILSEAKQEEVHIRTIASYLLKNNASTILIEDANIVDYVKQAVLQAFMDPAIMIRKAASQSIVTLLGVLEPINWQECLQIVVDALDNADMQEVAFHTLVMACEDFPRKMDFEINGSRPLDYLIPKFIELSEHPSSKMRSHALSCLSFFIPINCHSLMVHIDTFITYLFKRASDDDPSVRCNVCRALVLLLAVRPEKLVSEWDNLVEYMLYSTTDKHEDIALEACEFWLALAEDDGLAPYLLPIFGKLVPMLLECMVYSEDGLLWLGGDAEDNANIPDKDSDIKPRHYGQEMYGLGRDADNDDRTILPTQCNSDDDDEEALSEWNIRKCAARTLNVIGVRYGEDLLNTLLEPLKNKLWSDDWLQRESGISALGCMKAMEPHLPGLISYLNNSLNDPNPLVRSVTCRTIGQYASWCAHSFSEEHKANYFLPTMEGLIRTVLDNNKSAQEAACDAFIELAENAGSEMTPFLEPVLRNLMSAFENYQRQNTLVLYVVVGTLSRAVGHHLQNSVYVDLLMPPLLKKWSNLKDSDEDLKALLECLTPVTIAMGPTFLPYTGPIFDQCARIIHGSLLDYRKYQQDPDVEDPDKSESFLVVALELVAGLAQGLDMTLEPFIANTQPNLLVLLTACLKHPQVSVRQSAYALVGDMAANCFPLLRPHMPEIMAELINQLNARPKVEFIGVLNNAAWSVGEAVSRYERDDPEFQKWVQPLLEKLIPILLNSRAPRNLHENAALSIGRIGLMHPSLVAPHLDTFRDAWCKVLHKFEDNEEKDSAFRGFCTLVQTNHAGILKNPLWFCKAIVCWEQPSPELDGMFRALLQGLRQANEFAWTENMASFPPEIRVPLNERYGV